MTDPTITATAFDTLDLDPIVPPDTLVRRDGLVWMNTAGRLYVSRNEGQIFVLAYQGQECEGLTRSGWNSTAVCGSLSGQSQPLRYTEANLVLEAELPISGPLKSAEPLPAVWWYRREGVKEWTLSTTYPRPTEPGCYEVVGCWSGRVMPFDDTPGPDGKGAKSGVQVEVPAVGWPDGWCLDANNLYRYKWTAEEMAARGYSTDALPNTEPGRQAAWKLEGR